MKSLLLFVFVVFCSAFAKAQSVNTAYLCLSNGDVVLADLSNCSSTVVATNGQSMFDIAEGDTADTLYGIRNNDLFLIDLNTGNFTLLGSLNVIGFNGSFRVDSLVKESTGVLLGVNKNGNGELFRINVGNLTATNLGATGFNSAGDLTYFQGDLYLSAENNELVLVNVNNPAASSFVGSMASSGFNNVFGVVTIITADPCAANPNIELVATGGRTTKFVNAATGGTSNNCTNLTSFDIFGAAEVTSDIICSIDLEIEDSNGSNAPEYCSNGTTTLSTTVDPATPIGVYSYEWSIQGQPGVVGTSAILPININTTTTYNCVVTDSGRAAPDNIAVQSITVTVFQDPVWNPIGNIIAYQTYTLPAITGTNIPGNSAFYDNPTYTGTALNPGDIIDDSMFMTNPATIYVYGIDQNGCELEEQFTIEFVDVQVTITPGGIQEICEGDMVTLIATPSPTNAYGNYTYNWTDSQNTVYPNTASITFTATVDTTVAVTVNDTGIENGFSMGFDITDFTVLRPVNLAGLTDQNATGTYTFPPIFGTGLTGGERYYTQPNGMGTAYDSGDVVNASDFSSLPVQLYTYDDNGSCDDQESFFLNFDMPAPLTLTMSASNDNFCAGFEDGIGESTILMALVNPGIPEGTFIYEWTVQGSTTVIGNMDFLEISPLDSTIYECTVTDTGRSVDNTVTESISITVLPAPVLDVINNQNGIQSFTFPPLMGTGLSGNEMYFTQPNGMGDSFNPSDRLLFSDFNSYPVTLYAYDVNTNGCEDQVSFQLIITETAILPEPESPLFIVPQYMTPNNDGFHDFWQIEVLQPDLVISNFYIFDRYGKLLKQVSNDGPGWDATYNNQPLPSSTYWYSFEYFYEGELNQQEGFFAVKR
ncbi:MAG: T9SS type B sorting domain-containing protein [Nonlabens sp.]|uniref:T9SS type B sorting domain-containing protein n=1 Tax=Nonlabens sp. TaxID=1888209 RepID=UPI00321ACFFA